MWRGGGGVGGRRGVGGGEEEGWGWGGVGGGVMNPLIYNREHDKSCKAPCSDEGVRALSAHVSIASPKRITPTSSAGSP